MSGSDLITLSPLIALTVSPVVVMLAGAFWRSHALALTLTLLGLAATFGTLFLAAGQPQRQVTPLLSFDTYTLFYIGLITAATAVVAIISWGYLGKRHVRPEEYYVLLLTATLGGAALVASTHFASFFLGLEILSVSLYALIVYPIFHERVVEAAVKYLVLAGATSAFLVFGMALVYAETGAMTVSALAPILSTGLGSGDAVVVLGSVLLLVGVGFKLAVVPFHMWTPDVYQGAPAPVTAYVATVSKGAMFALLLRYFRPVSLHPDSTLFLMFAAVAILSMVVGNVLALRQDNVKRILAYSSIAHLGYLLVAFGVVAALSTPGREAEWMDDYRGLAHTRRWTAATFTVALFSLAGMPLTMGFIGKFYVVTAGAGASLWALTIVLVLTSTVSLYYYTRIVVTMWVREPAEDAVAARRRISGVVFSVLAALTVFLVAFGVYPAPLLHLIERAVSSLH